MSFNNAGTEWIIAHEQEGMLSWIESYDRFIAFSIHAVVSWQVNFFYRRGQREKVACRIYKLFKQILF